MALRTLSPATLVESRTWRLSLRRWSMIFCNSSVAASFAASVSVGSSTISFNSRTLAWYAFRASFSSAARGASWTGSVLAGASYLPVAGS